MPATITNALAYWRHKSRMKQVEVARRLGITNIALSLMETGRQRANRSELDALCRLYRCKPDDLYTGAELAAILATEG